MFGLPRNDTGEARGLYVCQSFSPQEERKARSENQHLPGQDSASGQRYLLAMMRYKTCFACPLGKTNRYYLEKFFLDDLIVAHRVWSPKQVLDKSQPEPSPILQRGLAGKEAACDWAKRGAGQAG